VGRVHDEVIIEWRRREANDPCWAGREPRGIVGSPDLKAGRRRASAGAGARKGEGRRLPVIGYLTAPPPPGQDCTVCGRSPPRGLRKRYVGKGRTQKKNVASEIPLGRRVTMISASGPWPADS